MSHANDLRQMIEVFVTRMQDEVVLQHQARPPSISFVGIGVLLPQLPEDSGIVMCRRSSGKTTTTPSFIRNCRKMRSFSQAGAQTRSSAQLMSTMKGE
jgi:hypothetical protein